MDIGVVRETRPGERRVALVPEGVRSLVQAGHRVWVEAGAGAEAGFPDEQYVAAGAHVLPDSREVGERAALQVRVLGPQVEQARGVDETAVLRPGTVLVGMLQPLTSPALVERLAARRVTSFSLDAMPRITRAQSMDVLSSMSTVVGYKAVLVAATALGKFFPMLTTAAGTIRPARVLVIGAGVAGLQAVATARRLGAVVQAFDARPEVREQVESLGARFVGVPALQDVSTSGGYARAVSEEELQREREVLREPVAAADVVISTAMVPGERAPLLITGEMAAAMAPGSVIVDVAAEAGGNCEWTVPGQRVVRQGIVVDGPVQLASTVPTHASQLFSRNLVTYLLHLLQVGVQEVREGEPPSLRLEDEIVKATLITHGGEVLHAATRSRMKGSASA